MKAPSGFIYAPYIPITTTPNITEGMNEPTILVGSRYSSKWKILMRNKERLEKLYKIKIILENERKSYI